MIIAIPVASRFVLEKLSKEISEDKAIFFSQYLHICFFNFCFLLK
jgi:hypothetical protein